MPKLKRPDDPFAKLSDLPTDQKLFISTETPAPKEVDTSTTQTRDTSRDTLREKPRDTSRGASRNLPTRDEIQEFSFQLRDELKVKVQAEVPYRWQDELEELARQLHVKKLELYRFILGEFLGKVRRKNVT